MDLIVLAARLLLAGVFVVAGFTKLKDQAGFRRALGDFGVPVALTPPVGLGIPLAELVVAVALISTRAAWWGALGAAALPSVFVAGITVNLLRGNTPDCHCFGQLHSEPASWGTVARNLLLILPAALILGHGPAHTGTSVTAWIHTLTPFQLVATLAGVFVLLVLAALGWFVLQLFQVYGRVLIRVEALEAGRPHSPDAPSPLPAGIPIGMPAPSFSLAHLEGGTWTLQDLLAPGKPVLLFFADPDCGSCEVILPEIAALEKRGEVPLTVALITRGDTAANRAKPAGYDFRHVLLQTGNEVAQAYGVPGTPAALLIAPDGTIQSPTALGVAPIRTLLTSVSFIQPTAVTR